MTGLYKQSVPVLIKFLNNLSSILHKAVEHAATTGMKHEELLTFRLREDMRPLTYQVQSCSNQAKFLATRVGGIDDIVLEDNEQTFDELQARIVRTIEILNTVKPENMDGKEDSEIIMKTKMGDFKFTGQAYVSENTIPNFHFHLTTAYCILRHLGVPIGAFDYLKDVYHKA